MVRSWPVLLVFAVVVGGTPCGAQTGPYGLPDPVDLDGLPVAFLLAEFEFINRTGSAISDGTEGVSSWDLLFDHLEPYANDDSPYYTGREAAFMARVREAAPFGSGVLLDPEDLYGLSLEVNSGDRFKALITVHDALKKIGRALQVGEVRATQVRRMVGDAFFESYEAGLGRPYRPVADANRLGEAYLAQLLTPIGDRNDYTGKYYHLFGTAAAGIVGGIAGIAHIPHARLKNAESIARPLRKRMLDFYGDNAFGRFIAATTGPAMAVGSLFGSFGEYTTVYRDKYDADNAGAEVGDALSDAPDRPARAVEGLLGGPRLSTYARRLTGERAEPVVVERASTGEGAAAPRSSSGGDEPAAAPAGGSHAGLVGALGN